jgi:hypothetical protein
VNGHAAFVTAPCSGSVSVALDPPANPDPQGQIAISGPGLACTKIDVDKGCCEICNATTISLTPDGYAVSTTAAVGSTSSSVAADLANKINRDTNLGPLFGAAASGATVYVVAKQVAIQYPWQTSCAYDSSFFSQSAFSASLSPGAAMVPK